MAGRRAGQRFDAELGVTTEALIFLGELDPEAIGPSLEHATHYEPTPIAEPPVPFVAALTMRVREIASRSEAFVHWGATSQDVMDTALVLLLRRAREVVAADHTRLARALRRLSGEYSETIMLSRTLLQPAPPTTFGYKAAGWYGAVHRSWRRVSRSFEEALLLHFGGASGTLA